MTLSDVWRVATSRTARRTAVSAVLLALASAVLYGMAVAAYVGFYREYIPHLVRTVPVYLQYGASTPAAAGHTHHRLVADAPLHAASASLPRHPYGLADLRGLGLMSDQDYDITVALSVPRSPANRAAGNFMLELVLAGGGSTGTSRRGPDAAALTATTRLPPPHTLDAHAFLAAGGRRVVFAAARPALLPYTDPLVAQVARLLFLPYYLLAPAVAERERLVVPMAEGLVFDDAGGGGAGPGSPAALPTVLFLELRSAVGHSEQPEPVQTYAAEVVFSARLGGLRWFMYQYWFVAFVVLTTAFWLVEVAFMVLVYVVLGFVWGGDGSGSESQSRNDGRGRLLAQQQQQQQQQQQPQIKEEEDTDDEGQTLPAIKREDSPGQLAGLKTYDRAEGPHDAVADDDGDDGNDDGYEEEEEDGSGDETGAAAANDRSEAAVVTGRSPPTEGPLRQRVTAHGQVV